VSRVSKGQGGIFGMRNAGRAIRSNGSEAAES
jgi:hypothetical protein